MFYLSPERRSRILVLALPIIGGMVSQNLLNIVDTAMVGFLGDPALAAVGLGGFVVFMCQALILGISTGVQTTAARRKGEGRSDRAAAVLNTALLLVLIVAPVFSVVLIQLADNAYPLLNDDPDVIALGVPYIEWRLGAIVFVGHELRVSRLLERARHVARIHEHADHDARLQHRSELRTDIRQIRGARIRRDRRRYGQRHFDGYRHADLRVSGLRHVAKDGFLRHLATRAETGGLIRVSLPAGLQQMFFAAGLVAMFWIIGKIGTPELAAANVLITVLLFAILPALRWASPARPWSARRLGRQIRKTPINGHGTSPKSRLYC